MQRLLKMLLNFVCIFIWFTVIWSIDCFTFFLLSHDGLPPGLCKGTVGAPRAVAFGKRWMICTGGDTSHGVLQLKFTWEKASVNPYLSQPVTKRVTPAMYTHRQSYNNLNSLGLRCSLIRHIHTHVRCSTQVADVIEGSERRFMRK